MSNPSKNQRGGDGQPAHSGDPKSGLGLTKKSGDGQPAHSGDPKSGLGLTKKSGDARPAHSGDPKSGLDSGDEKDRGHTGNPQADTSN